MKKESIWAKKEWLKEEVPANKMAEYYWGFLEPTFDADSPFLKKKNEYMEKMKKSFKEFTQQMCAGDEIWYFRSSAESWSSLSGVDGFAIVRDGEIVGNKLLSKS